MKAVNSKPVKHLLAIIESEGATILDLRNSDGPQNIPYEPRTFDVMPARDGGLSLRLNLRLPASN